MPAPLKPSARRPRACQVSVSTAAIAALLGLVGCDTPANQSDRSARAEIAKSQEVLATTEDPTRAAEQAQALLDSAAASATGAAAKVHAKSLLGQLLLKQARDLIWEIDRLDRDAQRLCTEITELSGQVRLSAQLAEGYKQFDPTPVINALEDRAAQARGGADQPVWFESDGVTFASFAALSQDISRLEGEIAAKQQEIESLKSQRASALSAAEDAAREAEATQGRSSVDAFTRSSNARRQASELGTQIDTLTASLEPLKTRLAIASAQKDVIASAARQLEAQTAALEQGWAELQKSAAAQSELAKRIVTAGATVSLPEMSGVQVYPAASLAQKAQQLDRIMKDSDALRDRAAQLLSDAAKHFGDAATAAVNERGELRRIEGERPGAPVGQSSAWKATRNAFSPGLYQVDQAEAHRLLAQLHAGHAAVLEARLYASQAAQTALPAAGVPVPGELQNGTADKVKTAMREADEAYKAADELLESIVTGATELDSDKAVASSARVSRIYTLYRWSILSADLGETEAARTHMESARNLVADAISNDVRLPRLPPELQKMVDEAPRRAPDATDTAPAEALPPEGQPGEAQPGEPTPENPTPPPEGTPPQPEQPAGPGPG